MVAYGSARDRAPQAGRGGVRYLDEAIMLELSGTRRPRCTHGGVPNCSGAA